MKTTLLWTAVAALIGAIGGVALGYWEARPWTIGPSDAPAAPTPAQSAEGAAVPKQPRAVVGGGAIFNFDKMEAGTTQSHVFPIRNEGGAPLTFEFVSHTCKCTSIELNGKSVEVDGQPVKANAMIIVPPGGQGQAMLEWVAPAEPGPFRHGATFSTNDPAQSHIELNVEGDVVTSTTLEPAQLIFGSIPAGGSGKAELLVMATLEPEVEILAQEIVDAELAERVKITVEPVAKEHLTNPNAQAGVRIIAEYEAGGTLGPFAGSLNLKTNLKRAASLKIPIYGNVKGDVSIFGKGWIEPSGLLRMDPATTAAGASTRLIVAIRGEHAAATELRVASVDPPELKAALGERKTMRDKLVHVPLTVEIPPGTRPMVRAGEDQGGEGEIVLSTTHPLSPEVRLRVNFTVKP